MVKKVKLKFIIFIFLILSLLLVAKFSPLGEYLSVDKVRNLVDSTGVYGPFIFILIYTVITITLLPGTPFTIASGVLFGTVKGGLLTVIGATVGATIAFLISRFFGEDFVEKILRKRFKKVYELDEKIEKKGFLVMLFLRLIPIFPFNGLNFAMGLTKIRLKQYFFGTLIGIIPGTLILANIGGTSSNLSSPQFILSIVLFIALILVLPVYKYARKKLQNPKLKKG